MGFATPSVHNAADHILSMVVLLLHIDWRCVMSNCSGTSTIHTQFDYVLCYTSYYSAQTHSLPHIYLSILLYVYTYKSTLATVFYTIFAKSRRYYTKKARLVWNPPDNLSTKRRTETVSEIENHPLPSYLLFFGSTTTTPVLTDWSYPYLPQINHTWIIFVTNRKPLFFSCNWLAISDFHKSSLNCCV